MKTFLARLIPRLFVTWVLCWVLYMALTQLGQVADLKRALSDDLLRHMFAALGFGTVTGFCLTLCLRGLASAGVAQDSETRYLVLTLLLANVGPVLLAALTFGYGDEVTIGAILGLVAGVGVPNFAIANMWFNRGTLPFDKSLSTISGVFVVLALGLYALLFFKTAFAGLMMGPIAVLFITSAVLMWACWFLFTRPPLVLIGLLIPLVGFVLVGHYGVRAVRTLNGPAIPRLSAKDHARGWLEARRAEIERVPQYPVFFVTSDGGGIRSSYWTAQLLGALADDNANFVRHTYVLSGVSGGSVGVSVFAAQASEVSLVAQHGGYAESARAMLGNDFLAAPTAQLLSRDPFESVFCHGLKWASTCSQPAFDRMVALETVFEGAFAMAVGAPAWDKSFDSLWAGERRWTVPALILNTTNAHTGEKRVVSTFTTGAALGEDQYVLARMSAGTTLRLSTAALLSARFPVISPTGEMALGGRQEQLVDGGYFDNSGGASAMATLPEFMQAVREGQFKGHVVPVAISITNDPDRAWSGFAPTACTKPTVEDSWGGASLIGVLTQPLGTLDAGRARAAETWRSNWKNAVFSAKGEFIDLPLFRCTEDADVAFPLGWTLSRTVRSQIDKKVERLKSQVDGPYQRVLGRLKQ
jgi:hypothetical protein